MLMRWACLKMDISPRPEVKAGDVGYIISGIKTASEVKVGDTITHKDRPCAKRIHGFEDVKPMVWAGIFPVDTDDYEEMRDAMEKLKLNDASLTWTPESSAALGFGFRCGFLGLLHMEIIQERLEREFNMTRDHHRAQRGLCGDQDQRRCDRGAQPQRPARGDAHRDHRGALHQGAGDHQGRVHRRHHDAVHREARHAHRPELPHHRPRGAQLRAAVGRSGVRLSTTS
jgi:hypothetical protein